MSDPLDNSVDSIDGAFGNNTCEHCDGYANESEVWLKQVGRLQSGRQSAFQDRRCGKNI
jgi:hypothetical protein